MRSTCIVPVLACALLLAATGAFAAKIVVEAESYKTITPSMKNVVDNTASGKRCITIPLRRPHAQSETGPSDNGNASYVLNIPSAGQYQFWGRCWWYDACGNSFAIFVDGNPVPYISDGTFQKWHWVAGPTLSLSAGQHTIRIQNREDGAKLDQWLLTTTPRNRWEPTRIETQTGQYIVR